MYSAHTQYQLANSPADYRQCHAFIRQETQHPICLAENSDLPPYAQERISCPTILARRDAKIIAVVGTRILPGVGIVANPFHMSYDLKNPVPVMLRLLDCYEYFLHLGQVQEYRIVVPDNKRFAHRICLELLSGELEQTFRDGRFSVYRIPLAVTIRE